MKRMRIRGATVVTPETTAVMDVVVEDGMIADVDAAAQVTVDEEVDGTGLHLLPGVVDDQVHFRDPGLTHKEDLATASRACAKGGVTTYLEMPNTRPAATTRAGVEQKLDLAAKKSLVNYGFYIGATEENLAELKAVRRTPGIKIFVGSSTGDLLVDGQEALERIFAETTLPIAVHSEDEATVRANRERILKERNGKLELADHSRIRDHEAAIVATRRLVDLATRHAHRLHVLHLTTAAEVEVVAAAGADSKGPRVVTVEVCPHHLFFSVDDYARLGTRVQMNPSVKTAADNEGLWQGLLDGKIQVIATDHAPHTLEEKAAEYPDSPSGLPAVENSLALMLDQVGRGRCTLEQVVGWMCDAPARVWDLVGKGRIARGYDADLVLVDLAKRATVRDAEQETKSKWSPWDGVELTGWPVRTWVGGVEVFREGKIDGSVRGREVEFDHARSGYWG